MKNFLHLFMLLSFLCFSAKSFAQGPSLGFDTPPVFPQTIALDDSAGLSVQMGIKNYGTASFLGNTPIYIVTKVMSSGLLISRDSSFNSIPQATIPSGQVYPFTYYEPYNTGRFAVGIDVVVIWPKAAGVATHDSITYIIQITPAVGLAELLAKNGLSVYPNPCVELLTIANQHPENPIERVRIYDLSGTLLLEKNRTEHIDLSKIPAAVYMVEVLQKSGMRKVMKVQKQGTK